MILKPPTLKYVIMGTKQLNPKSPMKFNFLQKELLLLGLIAIPFSSINAQCTADFNHNSDPGDHKKVFFNDVSLTDDSIVAIDWKFGLEGEDHGNYHPEFNFSGEGDYEVCLRIETESGCLDSVCKMVNIPPHPSCRATFHGKPDSINHLDIRLISTATFDSPLVKTEWRVDNATVGEGNEFNFIFPHEGEFDVCHVIETQSGCTDTVCERPYIGGAVHGDCKPNFVFEQDAADDKNFLFTDSTVIAGGVVVSWEWDFGDGIKAFTQNTEHVYPGEGMYNVCLKTISDSGCEEMHCDVINIGGAGCHADFGWDPIADKHYQFNNYSFSDTAIAAYSWIIAGFGYVDMNPSHVFPDTGYYEVELQIYNVSGCSDTVKKTIHVKDDAIHHGGCAANFDAQPNGGDGSSWDFADNSFADAGVKTWDFSTGDGYNYDAPNFVHAYGGDGDYYACLAIEANDGCRDTFCIEIPVRIDTSDHGGGHEGTVVPIQGCLASIWAEKNLASPNEFDFKSSSAAADGGALVYLWDVDGTIYNTESVQHAFGTTGEKKIILTVTGASCASSAEIKVVPGNDTHCDVSFTYVVDTIDKNRAQFALSGTSNLTGGFWQFGDGMQSDQKDPIHHFPGSGFYEVCVTAFDSASGCQANFCQPIEIKDDLGSGGSCFAQFDYQIDGDRVDFVNTSHGDFTNIHFMFGDGGYSDEPNPTHTYHASGVYDVCVNIFDSLTGCVSDFCMPITILADSADVICHADFDFFPIGERKFAFANHSQGSFSEVKWDFMGGISSMKDFETEFEFPGAGHFEVCLNVFDSASGCFNTMCKVVEIVDTSIVNCKADFDFFKEPSGDVVFNAKATGTFTNIHFTLGDGNVNDEDQFTHVYDHPGHYDVCMAIYDSISGCQDQFCKKVAVAPDTATLFCEAKMDGYLDDSGIAHTMNLSTGAYTNVHWNFGDGFHSNDENPTHQFEKSGFYFICLNIFDSISGCHSEICDEVNIQLDTNDVSCKADFNFMVIDNRVTFENTSIGGVSNAHWQFGDWSFSNNFDAVHEYDLTGVFPVCLDMWDSVTGCQAHVCKEVTVIKDTADVFCEAKFETIQLAKGEIQFTNASVGDFTHVHWDLGNGMFANHNDPIGFYPTGGVYPVSIMIWDSISGCQASYVEEVAIAGTVEKVECHAKFEFFPINDSLVKFKSVSKGDYTNIRWEFGDGTFAENDGEVEHAYPHGGFFNVCVGIFDSISGCHDFACGDVGLLMDTTVVDCHADFEFFPISATEVAFENKSAGTYNNTYWKFADGTVSYDVNPVVDFGATGLFGACLTVFDDVSGCQDEFCIDVPIIDDTTTYCDAHFGYFVDGKTVQFEPEIKGDITGWVWDFNDGFNTNDSFPTHTFEKDGVYDVCLTVFDSVSGCFNSYCDQISIITDVTIIDAHVQADFSYFLDPIDGKVHFKDESVGSPSNWYWDFGDGDSAGVAQNPTYEYVEDGYYEVCLTARNNDGGQETNCEVIAVGDVSDACFARFDYYANALTATAHFDNNALGRITGYEWDFGDALTSIQYQPTHTYADTGFYPVCLTVTNDSGCVKTYCKEIRVGNSLDNKCLIGCVWPGDANLDLEANHYDILPMGLHYGETGPAREEVSSDWRGHESQDWSSNLWGDVNNKHGDADGNGVIDIEDIFIVEQNFAYSHPWQPRAKTANQLSIDWDVDDLDVGETAVLTVSIPDSIDVTMYGVGFEIDLDPATFDYNTIVYDFSNSFLGTESTDLITFGFEDEHLGEIYIAESRNDHEEITGNGELVTIYVTAIANSSNAGAVLTTEGGVTAEGDTVQFNGAEDVAGVNSIEERDGYMVKDLMVFPNPTQGVVSYNLPVSTDSDYVIEVYNNVGALVHSTSQTGGGTVTTSFDEYESGIYTLQVSHEKVKYKQKVVLFK